MRRTNAGLECLIAAFVLAVIVATIPPAAIAGERHMVQHSGDRTSPNPPADLNRAAARQIEDQQTAMSGIFAIARKRYARGVVNTDLSSAEAGKVMGRVKLVVRDAPTADSRKNLLFVFAQTCEAYYFSTFDVGSYQLVFEYAMNDACEMLSKYPGPDVHAALMRIKQDWGPDPASPLNDYIVDQAKMPLK